MILYTVTVGIDKDIEKDWLGWMQATHIPDVMRTELFIRSRMARDILNKKPTQTVFIIEYELENSAAFERYQKEFAPALQKDHTERYAGKFSASRTVTEVVGEF